MARIMSAAPVVDLNHLNRYTGGDRTLNAEVLRLFDLQASEIVRKLRAILTAREAKSWREATHTLKGAAKGIGAFGLAEAATMAERLSPADEEARTVLSVLEADAAAVQAFIQDYLSR
jgi:HPt (histidine-containing phosphotransfer) domain-containing protein